MGKANYVSLLNIVGGIDCLSRATHLPNVSKRAFNTIDTGTKVLGAAEMCAFADILFHYHCYYYDDRIFGVREGLSGALQRCNT